MIILYSITGIITALFLVIIIAGAVRAHRHPERYGPQNIMGRPRQTRARGIARAMLDSIPIVKVGQREGGTETTKPTEVELENGQYAGEQDRASSPDATWNHETTLEGGAVATTTHSDRQTSPPPEEDEGCSICTEDFQIGEDQRVLPCDHRFHPECIDPWLLNVSGTCPLCRIDLRPTDASTGGVEMDANGNPIPPEGAMAPPLDGEVQRSSLRTSIMLGITGVPRPERMTREERIRALRTYREHQQARVSAAEADQPDGEESSRRRRLRNAFRIRTRRTGEATAEMEDTREEYSGHSPPASSEQSGGPSNTTTTTSNDAPGACYRRGTGGLWEDKSANLVER